MRPPALVKRELQARLAKTRLPQSPAGLLVSMPLHLKLVPLFLFQVLQTLKAALS